MPNLSEKVEQITPPTNPPIIAGRSTSNNEVGVPIIVITQSQTNTAELIETMDLKIRRTVNAFPLEIDHHIAFPTRAKLGTIVI